MALEEDIGVGEGGEYLWSSADWRRVAYDGISAWSREEEAARGSCDLQGRSSERDQLNTSFPTSFNNGCCVQPTYNSYIDARNVMFSLSRGQYNFHGDGESYRFLQTLA
jgi:hypothetical protein